MTVSVAAAHGPILPGDLDPDAQALVRTVVDVAGDHLAGVVIYGSQLLRAEPNRHSAWDMVFIVDRYGPFHRALVDAGLHRGPAWVLDVMARVLPPWATMVEAAGAEAIGKCMVVSRAHFERAVRPRSPDHFLKGRMVQRVALVWAKDAEAAGAIEGWLRIARRDVLRWAGPWLDEPFDAVSVSRRMLEVSYGGELRPENTSRALEIHQAQAPWLREAYAEVLEEAASDGQLIHDGEGAYRFARPPGRGAWLRTRLYFMKSKARATLRWFKYIVTFDGWLPYLVRKVERRTGEKVELTRRERRYPLIFLWPRVVRFFLDPARRTSSDGPDS
ncbi:MAG TPA: hypothetical protein VJ925_02000 [Longimicrobiales bacterium]|nr:hypothetical protein [Longimicrobiales bacterium]